MRSASKWQRISVIIFTLMLNRITLSVGRPLHYTPNGSSRCRCKHTYQLYHTSWLLPLETFWRTIPTSDNRHFYSSCTRSRRIRLACHISRRTPSDWRHLHVRWCRHRRSHPRDVCILTRRRHFGFERVGLEKKFSSVTQVKKYSLKRHDQFVAFIFIAKSC